MRQSPQAKGRVERANRTLQDRLVKEMRDFGISDINAGNAMLEAFGLGYNKRFACDPQSTHARTIRIESSAMRTILTKFSRYNRSESSPKS